MGAKGSKPEPKPNTEVLPPGARVIELPRNKVIDMLNPEIFPEKVRNEFLQIKQQIPPTLPFYVWLFKPDSELMKWLRQCRSYFDYYLEPSNEETNKESNNNETKRQKYLQKCNKKVAKDKLAFASNLSSICDSPDIEFNFLINQLELYDQHMVLAFSNTGHIVGFSILGFETQNDDTICLHRTVTCTGPRNLGLGRLIVDFIHKVAKDSGFKCITLGASGSEGFHKKMGYVLTGKKNSEGPQMLYTVQGGKSKTRKQKNKKRNTRKHK